MAMNIAIHNVIIFILSQRLLIARHLQSSQACKVSLLPFSNEQIDIDRLGNLLTVTQLSEVEEPKFESKLVTLSPIS
jgi:hypothetical protein